MKLEFSRQIYEKKVKIGSFITICPVGAALFHADGQTTDGRPDMTKLKDAFRNFVSAPKK